MGEADLYPTAVGSQCDRDMPECTGGWRERGIREGATQMTLKLQLDGRVGVHQAHEWGKGIPRRDIGNSVRHSGRDRLG